MRQLLRLASGSRAGTAWSVVLLIRLHVGLIFILAGSRKLLEYDQGPGRFEGMGMAPFMGYWVGFWELLGGACVLAGLLTRAAAIPLVVVMLSALYLTKLPQFGEGDLVAALHASRLDFALLTSSVFLVISGGGRFAVDRLLPAGGR